MNTKERSTTLFSVLHELVVAPRLRTGPLAVEPFYNEIISVSKSDTFGTSVTNAAAVSHFIWSQMSCSDKECQAVGRLEYQIEAV